MAAWKQLVESGGPGRSNRGVDAAPGPRDVHIRLTREAPVELLLPRSRPHRVGVWVDKAGNHTAAGCVEDLIRGGKPMVVLGCIADKDELGAIAADDGVAHRRHPTEVRAPASRVPERASPPGSHPG